MKAVIFTHVLYLILIQTFMAKGVFSKCESKVELRAVLLSCPAKETGCEDDDPLTQVMKAEESQILQADSKNFESLKEEKERGFPSVVKDCKRKIIITLKVKNYGKIPCEDEYIVVDHVFDPVTGGRGRLLSPVVVKLRQEQMVQMYGLQFQRVVNSDPFEEQKAGDKTCSVDPENPTCGIAMYDGKPIPFSEGFCCSCDPHVNAKRQLSPVSRGDSLLYRDSKLISQGNTRFLREEKLGAIVNPKLVQLKSGNSEDVGGGKKGSDCGGIGDPACWDKLPNYLLERDRKIVCDNGDFMKELCKLQSEKNEAEANGRGSRREDGPTKKTSESEGLEFTTAVVDEEATDADVSGEEEANDDVATLKSFMKALNAEWKANSASPPESHGPGKGSRGKRENRREIRKLTLEEKLERFANEKRHLVNRRKRLLEVSHRRFRKADETCKGGPQSQSIMVKGCTPDLYMKPPPRYFFSHDKTIIDPLESVDVMVNSTCKSLAEPACGSGDTSKGRTCRPRGKCCKGDKGGKPVGRGSYQRSKYESRPMRKEKYLEGRMSENMKEKPGGGEEDEGGLQKDAAGGNGDPRMREFKFQKEGISRGNGRFDQCKDPEKSGEEMERKETIEVEDNAKNKFSAKCLRNFLRKSESERKQLRPKIRNFFIAKNRERQQLKSDFSKLHRKPEFKTKENVDGEKCKQRLKANDNTIESQEFQGKKADENEKEREGPASCLTDSPVHTEGFNTERYNMKQRVRPSNKEFVGNREKFGGDRKFLKEAAERKEGRLHPPKESEGDVNFNVEIIRNQNPEAKTRYRPTIEEQFMKNRLEGAGMGPKLAVAYGLGGKSQYAKSRHNFAAHSSPSRNYYVLQNGRVYPQEAIMLGSGNFPFIEIKSRPRVGGTSFEQSKWRGRMQGNHNAFAYQGQSRNQKQNRRYYVPLAEGDRNPGRGRQTPSSNRDEGRGKRHSESTHKWQRVRENVGRRLAEADEGSRSSRQKTRSKRSVSYSFQPALGFYESEFESRKPDEHFVHELETCLTEDKARKREADGWPNKIVTFCPPRVNADNSSAHRNALSGSPEVRSNHAGVASRETAKREKSGKCASDEQRLYRSYLNAPDYVLKEVEGAQKGKRQANELSKPDSAREDSKDKFGGEYCQDTAHCMRFGDLWYGMYSIRKPVIAQIVGVQLFDKHPLCDGTSEWRDLTKGRMIRIGTFFSKAEDELPTMSLTFMGEKAKKVESAIDPDNYFLLIPSHVSDPSKVNSYPQFEGGPGEYMLVQSKDISSGGECNMIGTSFEAFARQPDRCAQRRGSCLKRQPVDLWREDMEARIRGKRGRYFVENFGNLPNSPVKTYTNLSGEFLALEYYGEYTSTIEIEVKADSNAIIRKGSNAQIPLVYIDSTYPKKTRIILSVLNIGLTSSNFRPRLGDCPPDLDPAWCPLEGPLVTISPQQRHDFKLDLSGNVPNGQICLTVQVLNQVNKQIAYRKIIIKRGDRCVCAFHCKCNCIGNLVGGRTCRKLSLEEYRKAGYIGSYPFRGGAAASAPESILGNIHIVILTACYFLLILGLLKGILGIFFRRMGIAGTRIITGPRELTMYYECELQGCSVLYDECGFPLHPTTCQPVQIVPLYMEVIINLFFFFLYPLRGIWFLILSLSCCKACCSDFDGMCRDDEGECDHMRSPLLSRPAVPTCVHYSLTTVDTKKAKQGYLPYLAYKGDDDPLEEDDTEYVLQEMKRYRKK